VTPTALQRVGYPLLDRRSKDAAKQPVTGPQPFVEELAQLAAVAPASYCFAQGWAVASASYGCPKAFSLTLVPDRCGPSCRYHCPVHGDFPIPKSTGRIKELSYSAVTAVGAHGQIGTRSLEQPIPGLQVRDIPRSRLIEIRLATDTSKAKTVKL
jgi:hypothetical protein